MNGRLYDPLLRRFLNADENIQDPHNTQNYNKYGYVMNNPLMFNDPSGEFFAFIGLGIMFWKAVIIGAAVGLVSYSLGVAIAGQKWNLGNALKSIFFGAVSGAVTCGIGDLFKVASVVKAIGNAKFLIQGMAHGVSQGVLSIVQGGKFLSGAAAGFFGSLGAEAWGASMKGLGLEKFASSTIGTISFGALSGGVGSSLSGGNFWDGAIIGGIVAGLNHSMHKIGDPITEKRKQIVEKVKSHEGETDWELNGRNGRYGSGRHKCNVFVDDVLDEVGIYTPDPNGMGAGWGLGTAVTAGQWADPSFDIPGWKIVNSPQAGDVVAISANFTDASGHVGIMISPTKSIYAGDNQIKTGDFGYNKSHYANYPGNRGYVYRRYVGLPVIKMNYNNINLFSR